MTNKPTIRERARIAWNVFRNGYPRDLVNGPQGSKAGNIVMWPAWREGQPQWQIVDLQSYIDEGFNANSIIYSAVMYKVRSIGIPKLRAYRGDPDEPEMLPPNHPLAKLVARPNSSQSWMEFIGQQDAFLNLSGNAYTLMHRTRRNALPEALIPLNPLRVYIVPGDKGTIRGYWYVPEGVPISDGTPLLPEDVSHVKLPNPGDPLDGQGYGLSPVSPLARSGDVDNTITKFIKNFFDSGTMINTYITFKNPMDKDVLAASRDRFMEIYGGSENWVKVAALDNEGSIQRFGMTFEEFGFETLDARNEARMTGPLGVPMILIETRTSLTGSTYTNKIESRRMYWEDTMTWECRLFEADLQYYLQSDDGGFVAMDYSDVPALRRDVPQLVQAAYQLWQMGETRNNAYAMVGLQPVASDTPGADTSYISTALMPAGSAAPEPEASNVGAPEAEEDARDEGKTKALAAGHTSRWSAEEKAAMWHKLDAELRAWEPKFREAARRAMERDKREVLALVTGAKKSALARKATVDWEALERSINDYLDEAGAAHWREVFAPLIQGVVTEQAKKWIAELGVEFDVQNLFARDWFNEYMLKFAQEINQTTKEDIAAMLAQAQKEGWSIPTMQGHLDAMFTQWMTGDLSDADFEWFEQRMPWYRLERIARTESIRASNAGSWEIYKEFGSKQKEWLATRDDRTRDAHAEADGQVVGIDEPFNVGGESLQFPGDPAGSAENTISCRCTILPVIE